MDMAAFPERFRTGIVMSPLTPTNGWIVIVAVVILGDIACGLSAVGNGRFQRTETVAVHVAVPGGVIFDAGDSFLVLRPK